MLKEPYQQKQQRGTRGGFAGKAGGGGDGPVKTGTRDIIATGINAIVTMDITANVKVVMEGMTTLVTTCMAMIIAASSVIMGKYQVR